MSTKTLNKKLFGKKIREAREKAGYTQFVLSEKIEVSSNFLGDIERGIKLPSIETFIRLCNCLKVSPDTLFADSLDLFVNEDETIVYTDKQKAILNNIIKTITDNFGN